MKNTMSRGKMRSSVLSRAMAQLAGKRVPVESKESANKHQKTKQDPSNFLDDDDDDDETKQYDRNETPTKPAGPQSRFLKKKTLDPNIARSDSNQKKYPTQQLELRKPGSDVPLNEKAVRTSEDGLISSSEFSSSFLRKKVNIKMPQPDIDKGGFAALNSSTESTVRARASKEYLQSLESSLEVSEELDKWWKIPKPPRTPSPPSKGTPRRSLHRSPSALGFNPPCFSPTRFLSRSPSPPSRGPSRLRRTPSLTRLGSRSPSPSMRSSLTSSTPRTRLVRRSCSPVSQRSDIKSLDELFSRTEDVNSTSSNDFKWNILSLDDLEPNADRGEANKKKRGKEDEAKQIPHSSLGQARTPHVKERMSFPTSGADSTVEEYSVVNSSLKTTSVISEHVVNSQYSSPDRLAKESDNETTINSAYSEDFEESEGTISSSSEDSSSCKSYSESKLSMKHRGSSRHSVLPSFKLHHNKPVKEMAVQTSNSDFPLNWTQGTSALGHGLSYTFMEPVSIASHVMNPELIDALSTHNPVSLVLNDLFKQQFLLTKNFVDMACQHYLSTVSTLERERYHYTTLEDTKEYIRQEKSRRQKIRSGQVLGEREQ
uniref:DUF4614 domain-containing protein n=1 Tax=Leptobrachium leishanense TaxID=445787 RepID=A0A8C5QJZ6_9ANUR